MSDAAGLVDPFLDERDLLFTIAYELLGSVADAEDVVQEAWLRWREVDHAELRHPRAYAVRIVTRQALNRWRTVRRRREAYVGPWLPEPVLTLPDVADDVVLAESLSSAVLVVLETLTPLERAVFVLREVFGFSHDEVADAVGRSPAACRQLAHRARAHVAARQPRFEVDPDARQAALDRFLAAAVGGDLQALLDVLAPDVVLVGDGGGVVSSARRPIEGAAKVARFLLGLVAGQEGRALGARVVTVNGGPALLIEVDGRTDGVVGLDVRAGRIVRLTMVRNPEKLTGLVHERSLRRRWTDPGGIVVGERQGSATQGAESAEQAADPRT